MPNSAILTQALCAHQAGICCIPTRGNGIKAPIGEWKEFEKERPSLKQIYDWYHPNQEGLGVITGAVSGNLEALDFDRHEVFDLWAELLCRVDGGIALLNRLTNGYLDHSPNGNHIFYRCSEIEGSKKLAQTPAIGEDGNPFLKTLIETKGEGGFLIIPPSHGKTHPEGLPYTQVSGGLDTICRITPEERSLLFTIARSLDECPREEHKPPPHSSDTSGTRPGDLYAKVTSWDEVLTPHGWTRLHTSKGITYWLRPGKRKEEGHSATTNFAGLDLFHPFTTSTIFENKSYGKFSVYTFLNHGGDFHAAAKALSDKGYGGTPPPPHEEAAKAENPEKSRSYHDTDKDNGERLFHRHGNVLRWCQQWKSFLLWDGSRWAHDHTLRVEKLAIDTIMHMYTEGKEAAEKAADATIDEQERKAFATQAMNILKHARKSENTARIDAMIKLVKPLVAITPEVFDTHPWLFNCANGTINLKTEHIAEAKQEQYFSKISPVAYNPAATCHVWESFLDRIMNGRKDLIEYIQRAVGYSMTGDTSEECLFLCYGEGANGKSTFLTTLRGIFGDYGYTAAFSSFIQKDNDPIRNDIADMRGTRLCIASEVDEGKKFSEQLIKQLTGRDSVRARFLYQESFEYTPEHKLWFGANHKPVITGSDAAIWRRIHLIPFTVTIPESERDFQLRDKLRKEWPGILAWAVRGCSLWQFEGLNAPDSVIKATKEYRDEMNVFVQWFEEYCVIDPNGSAKAGDLFLSYQKNTGDRVTTQTAFGRKFGQKGFVKKRDNYDYTRYYGVRLVESEKP